VPVVYLDSSALVKLLIDEPESDDLERHLVGDDRRVWSSALARVEVTRAVSVAALIGRAGSEVEARLRAWTLVAVTDAVLADAAALASARLRSLDAIHLASARAIPTDEFITYDERLAEAARGQGMTVVQPGAERQRGRRVHDRDG
jgi:predicted nucleic acid-binding protein